ncbi:MAG: hypothetical protein R6V62_00410 [Candidatus Fermentibacteraceae bacterium]
MKAAWFVPVLIAVTAGAPGNLGPGALSGVPGLPLSDVLSDGQLRLRTGFEYTDHGDMGGTSQVPFNICFGLSNVYEVGATIPVRLPDDDNDGLRTGDLALSGAMLYETARGGTALKFTGSVFLPTGEAPLDPGAGIAAGAVTTTTFRLFRFSAAGQYRVMGGQEPSKSRWRDSIAFSFGGMSFLGEAFAVFTSLSGSTEGTLVINAGASIEPWRELVIDGSVSADMESHGEHGVSLGAAWTFTDL